MPVRMEKPLKKWYPKVTPWGRPPDPLISRPLQISDTTFNHFWKRQGVGKLKNAFARKRVQTRLPVGTHDRGIHQFLRQGFLANPMILIKSDI